jgi:hypothetical protein
MAPGHMTGLLLVLCRETVLLFLSGIIETSIVWEGLQNLFCLKKKKEGEISGWKTIWKAARAGNANNSRKTIKIRDARMTDIQRQQEPQQQQEGQRNVICPPYKINGYLLS